MTMKIYLAANYSRHPEMREVRKLLEERGHTVTSRWINGNHELLEGQDRLVENARFAEEDLEDLESSNCIIWFSTPGQEARGRGGRHVEFGYAIGRNISVLVVGRKENVFHYLPQVMHFETLQDLIKELKF